MGCWLFISSTPDLGLTCADVSLALLLVVQFLDSDEKVRIFRFAGLAG
jgi:hypothetical protein